MSAIARSLVVIGIVSSNLLVAGEPPAATIGNRTQPTETQICALAKSFCVAMRRLGNDGDPSTLRRFVDPRYLTDHGLETRPLSMETTPVAGVRNIRLAADRHTVVCLYETANGDDELMLLRVVVHDKVLYLEPPSAPNPETSRFAPWLLRMER